MTERYRSGYHGPNPPTCTDCGAFVQLARIDGRDVERCPWARVPRDCARPYARGNRPDLAVAFYVRQGMGG